jgi:hypothetical protein
MAAILPVPAVAARQVGNGGLSFIGRLDIPITMNCCLCINHGSIMPRLPKNKKPTVGFSARFFLERSILRKIQTDKDLQTQKTTKT